MREDAGVTVVVITRDRCAELVGNLVRLCRLDDVREVVVVDNGSRDGTAHAVATQHPDVVLLRRHDNGGAAARTCGVEAARTEVVAFADDDSWWAPGSLDRAARLFAEHPRLALVHARLVVEPGGTEDPVCALLAAGPREASAAGPSILGHLACSVAVRRSAYLAAGGYHPAFGVGGEERLLALDLARLGWQQWYVEELTAHHRPSPSREPAGARRARSLRNDALTAWLRLPVAAALAASGRLVREAATSPWARHELTVLARLVAMLRAQRRVVPEAVQAQLRALDRARTGSGRAAREPPGPPRAP